MFDKDSLLDANPSPDSPHQIIPSLIKPSTIILDVGCNTGMLGKKLHSQNTLDGIDINASALKIAQPYYRQLYCLDLSSPKNINLKIKYDYIVLSDILEHLPRPDLLLLKLKSLLQPHGQIICSLPNVGRLEIRLRLLFGHFDYTASGIINRDHLRYFTLNTGRLLFEDTGYRVTKIIPTGLAHKLKIFPTLLAFQFIYLASPSP